MKEFIVSWDIAKQNDATVIQFWWYKPVILGDKRQGNERFFCRWQCDYIIKWEQMPYTDQVEKLALILEGAKYKNNHILLMDGTGVGQAVADLARSKGLKPVEIVFSGGIKAQPLTYGQADSRFSSDMDFKLMRGWSVPKQEMITDAHTMLEQDRAKVYPGTVPYAAEFKLQLEHFQGKVNEKGHTTYGNDNEAKHDDFVASFLMFCWQAKQLIKSEELQKAEKPVVRANQSYDWNPLKILSNPYKGN